MDQTRLVFILHGQRCPRSLPNRLLEKFGQHFQVDIHITTSAISAEAMALAQLNHRNVCQVHDWLEWGPEAFIAMEFIEGVTLAEAAPILGLSVSSLSDLECGLSLTQSNKAVARILGATGGAVTADDLQERWRLRHRLLASRLRAAGRGAMRAFRTAAKKPRKSGD